MSIYVCGALHLDVIVSAERLPRLDETLMGREVIYRLGGKGGNQAIAAAQLGANVSMAGCVGEDENGRVMLSTLQNAGVNIQDIQTVQGASGMSVAIVDGNGEYGAVVVSAANLALADSTIRLPTHAQIVLLQNEIPETVNLQIAKMAREQNCQVIFNAAPYRAIGSELASAIDILIVNRTEASDMLGGDNHTPSNEEELIAGLSKTGFADILLTAGANGVYAYHAGQIHHYPAPCVRLLSAHGAGDAFAGGLAAGLCERAALDEAIALGQKTAAFKISTPPEKYASMTRSDVLAL